METSTEDGMEVSQERECAMKLSEVSLSDVEEDEPEKNEENKPARVEAMDLIRLGGGVILYIVDIVLDICAACEIYNLCSREFTAAAIIFIIVPAIITNLISWLCYMEDNNTSVSSLIIHLFLLGHVTRLMHLFQFALSLFRKNPKAIEDKMRKYRSLVADVSMIGMMEALLESDPQAILQMSRIIPGNPEEGFNFGVKRTMSAVMSFVSVGFAIASYHVSVRMPQSQKKKISKKGYLIHWIWHLLITASRVISLSCLVSVLPYAVLIGGLVHIFFALIYLRIPGIGPERQFDSFWQNLGLHLLISFAYLFYAIPVCDGSSRRFYTCMYFIFFVEDVLAVTYWYFQLRNNLALMILISSLFTFILGISFMLLYYKKFHPTMAVTNKNFGSPCKVPMNETKLDDGIHNENIIMKDLSDTK